MKLYEPLGQPSTEMAAGGPLVPGMPMPPQAGRTDMQFPMPMAGNSQPASEPSPAIPPAMGPGGPLAPGNIGTQGMLQPRRMPFGGPNTLGGDMGVGGGGSEADAGAGLEMGGGAGGMSPTVMMRLMKTLGRL